MNQTAKNLVGDLALPALNKMSEKHFGLRGTLTFVKMRYKPQMGCIVCSQLALIMWNETVNYNHWLALHCRDQTLHM